MGRYSGLSTEIGRRLGFRELRYSPYSLGGASILSAVM